MTFDPFKSHLDQMTREVASMNVDPLPDENPEDHEAHAAGQVCARCHEQIKTGEDVRRNASHEWVHESCPPVASTPEA